MTRGGGMVSPLRLGGVNAAAAMAGGKTGVDILLSGTAGPAAIVASELDHTGVLLLAA